MICLDSNFNLSLEDVNNNYIDDDPFLDDSDGLFQDINLIGLDSVTGAGMERGVAGERPRQDDEQDARMTGADTGVHENTLDQTGENSGGRGGSVTAGEAGMQGHAADDAAGIRGQPRGGGGGRVTAGGAGLRGHAAGEDVGIRGQPRGGGGGRVTAGGAGLQGNADQLR